MNYANTEMTRLNANVLKLTQKPEVDLTKAEQLRLEVQCISG